ncbi:EF-hand domain-containing protein [Rhizobium sp. ZK1]|uniref:EF-hand domain-containing protein n=1 Tax=Rhizobium sp. ZK1 TaxID=3389872 RepID=UPI0039F68A76
MTMTSFLRPAALAALVTIATTAGAAAQTTPPAGGEGSQGQPGQWGTMWPGMMGHMMGQGGGPGMMWPGMMGQDSDMMGQQMMGRGVCAGYMGGMPMAMRGRMMKVMFAVADTNGDGGLSFDEVMSVHKRIFDIVDANKDGKVTPEEVQGFMAP